MRTENEISGAYISSFVEGLQKLWRVDWKKPPKRIEIKPGEVHVWRMCLDVGNQALADSIHLLSKEESERATQLCYTSNRNRFIARRIRLRQVLACYLGTQAKDLKFNRTSQGKPFLAYPWSRSEIVFSQSHSGGLALLAIGRNRRLGVDIELHNQPLEFKEIACRFFTPGEAHLIASLRDTAQAKAFFACWTAKEACLKALGLGLSGGLDRLAFPLRMLHRGSRFVLEDRLLAGQVWTGLRVDPTPNSIAILVAEGSEWEARWWEMSE